MVRAILGRVVHFVRSLIELLLYAFEKVAEFPELGFHRREQIPDFAGTFLNRESAKTHLQAVQKGSQRGRSGKDDLAFSLHLLDQPDTPDRFRIQSFCRQKHEREIGCPRRIDVFRADIFRAFAQLRFEPLHRCLKVASRIRAFLRRNQAMIIFDRKFRIDRQPDRPRHFLARQLDRVVDRLAARLRVSSRCARTARE